MAHTDDKPRGAPRGVRDGIRPSRGVVRAGHLGQGAPRTWAPPDTTVRMVHMHASPPGVGLASTFLGFMSLPHDSSRGAPRYFTASLSSTELGSGTVNRTCAPFLATVVRSRSDKNLPHPRDRQ